MSLHIVTHEGFAEDFIGQHQLLDLPLETNVVRLDTDTGITGWGECCVPPPWYHPTLGPAEREAIEACAPLVLSTDPRTPRATMDSIERAMRGHQPAKAAIDMALWDLCGKVHGAPLCDLWGGRVTSELPVLAMVSTGTPAEMVDKVGGYRDAGYSLFQIKVGFTSLDEDVEKIMRVTEMMRPGERCWFDANRGWTIDEAMRVLTKVAHLRPLIEQPCETYRECATVSRRTGWGLMLDESIDSPQALIRATDDGVIDGAVLKQACVGGLTKQKFLAELGAVLGIPMRIENFFGTGLTMAAVAHLAHTLPSKAVFGLYDYHTPAIPVVANPLIVRDGRVAVPHDCGPGLGSEVNAEVLGEPVTVVEL